MQEQTVIFFHIHKTGGQTLAGVMHRQYPRGTVLDLWLQRPETIAAFIALPESERANLRAITGHMPFGFHRYFRGGARYVTLLRDPVKRFLSEYRHLCDLPEEWGVWRPPASSLASVDSYLDYLIEHNLCDAQTRMVGGFVGLEDRPPLQPLPSDALAQAKKHLEHDFAVVGTTERFDESLVLMGHVFGWEKSLHYMRRNVRDRQQHRLPVSEKTLARIRESNALDVELVSFGSGLLDAQIRQAGDALREPLRRLQRVNAYFDHLLAFAHHPAVRSIRALPGLRQLYNVAGTLVRRVS
jgi:hypothetical protein